MMSRCRPLFVLAIVACAAGAHAQEMIEVPTPPPAPPPAPPDYTALLAKYPPRPSLLFSVEGGASYLRAFDADFAGAGVGIAVGGQTRTFSIGARLRGDLGSVGGLPFESGSVGPQLLWRFPPRLQLGVDASFGGIAYQRASRAGDATVWAPSVGAGIDLTVDVKRTRRGGALYAAGRFGFDWIDNVGRTLAAGASLRLGVSLGYRY